MFEKRDLLSIIAFDKDWKRKGIVDPSLRDNVSWCDIGEALSFIKSNKPKDEHWLIELDSE